MFNFLKGIGNQHVEATRLLGFIAAVVGMVYAGVHLVVNHTFSIIDFGIGMGTLIAGVAGGSGLKEVLVANAKATNAATESQTEITNDSK